VIDINKWKSRILRFRVSPKYFLRELIYYKFTLDGLKRNRLDLKQYFNGMLDFIKNYDVNSIKIESEYLWPYLRNHIWIQTSFAYTKRVSRIYLNPIAIQNGHYRQVPIELRLKLKYICDAYEIKELKNENCDFLFFINSNGTEEISIGSEIYHRIIDPVYEVAQNIGTAEKFEIVKSSSINPLKWNRYHNKSKLVFFGYEEPSSNLENLEYDEKLFSLIKEYLPFLVLDGKKQLEDLFRYELHIRNQYIKLLKKVNPKVILLHGFHYQAPLISAADSLGILTVDLQHGIQVGWNPLYNHHEELPDSGYQAYPDFFAVWGEKEYKNIEKNFKSKKHKPIYFGNPWLKKLDTLTQPPSEELIQKLNSDKINILIIMQNQPMIPKLFLEIISASDDSILWIVRHHPKGRKYKPHNFGSSKDNILIDDEIDSILFNQLFKYVNIAISEGSTLAQEASYYGVHNIITGEVGLDNYRDEINKGIFHYLNNANDFKKIYSEIKSKDKKNKFNIFKDVNMENFLNELLIKAEEKRSNLVIK
jgi:hypothetical protein